MSCRVRIAVLLLAACGGVGALAAPAGGGPQLTRETLPALLERATRAFSQGDFAQAAAAFGAVERDFGREPPWTDGTLPRRVLPLRGYAELRAGMPAEAAASLAAFLERFPQETSARSFALYSLALALAQSGQSAEAERRFAQFVQEFDGTAQAALARGQRAELLFAAGRAADGFAELEALVAGAPSALLRVQARLRLIERALEREDHRRLRAALLGEPWSVDSMPELGLLARFALAAGERWLANEQAADALTALRLVLPRDRLVEAQRRRVAELRRLFAERAPAAAAGGGAVWVEYYRNLIARAEAHLAALETADDYTPGLRLRLGQAYLLAGRPREAWLLFEHLATGELDAALREEAHYRWILAASAARLWDEALAIARNFTARYPDSAQAPPTFYLIAQAHLESQRFTEATEVLGDLITRFPEHPLHPQARFTRGYARAVLGENAAAREDFAAARALASAGPLAEAAALWHALTHLFGRDYAAARREFDQLVRDFRGRPLEGEAVYRRAVVLYAQQDLPAAAAGARDFLARFPRHVREAEALVLLGDVLMGLGELDDALAAFGRIDPAAASSFVYGTFQIGKILRARGDLEALADHFAHYAARTDLVAKPRVSEALYWIGWVRARQDRVAEALPPFLEALAAYGDDPAEAEIPAILEALERLHRRVREAPVAGLLPPGAAPLLAAESWAHWVEEERARALGEGRYTWFARLTLWQVAAAERARQPYRAEALLLEIAAQAPLDRLDAAALARTGRALQQIGAPSARDYYARLLAHFPAAPDRAYAFLGYAEAAAAAGAWEEALAWTRRLRAEVPLHPLAPAATLLGGRAALALGRLDRAEEDFLGLLALRSARGRPHAEALAGLAEVEHARAAPARALAYWQRLYTLHRAQPDLVARAYLESGRLFDALGDTPAALRTFEEMLAAPELATSPLRPQAEQERDRLAADAPALTLSPP
jgi:tetratricopeptide (TPR) repeat protein